MLRSRGHLGKYERRTGADAACRGCRVVGIPGVPELAARTAAATGDFNGAWLLTEGEGLLKIEGTEWRRPDKGLGALSSGRGSGEYEVTSQQHQGIKCASGSRKQPMGGF